MDGQDEGLARLTDLDVTWGFDLHAFVRDRSQEASVAGDAGDVTAETVDSSQGGAVDASLVPVERAETVDTMNLSQGGAVDASPVPGGRAESDSDIPATSGTDQRSGEDPPVILSERAAHELSSWGRLPPTGMGWTRVRANACRVNLLNVSV